MKFRILNLVRRAISKPFPVVYFKVRQAIHLQLMHHFSGWKKITARSEGLNNHNSCEKTILLNEIEPVLSNIQRNALEEIAKNVIKSKFLIFGEKAPNLMDCNFSEDWRFGRCWLPKYFKKYSFYEEKELPYDVKFPWELSRFHYLIPVMAWQLSKGADKSTLAWMLKLLIRWRQENPLAYSVNWYPMEASIRMINLVILFDFVSLLSKSKDEKTKDEIAGLHKILLTMIREHGEFVWVNREFTDIRGNHFTANLVALLFGHLALKNYSAAPIKWRKYVDHWLEKEISLQFYSDGVNFEKSCGYHKLVAELFVLAGIVLDKAGSPINYESRQRLKNAAFFSDSIARPDGLAANFGDNDDAVALPFVFDNPRSHGSLVELTRSWLKAPIGTNVYKEVDTLAALFIMGQSYCTEQKPTDVEVIEFPEGGYTVVRNNSNGFFFMVDVGEVGMNGRGGHGHNDLLSFELCIDGLNVVIDPGCSGYTADLKKKRQYRSTSVHSTVQLYDEEIAKITGDWTISNDAIPKDISVLKNESGAVISASHGGYCRIKDNSYINRQFSIDACTQSIIIDDEIDVPNYDKTKVTWHYPVGQYPNIKVMDNDVLFGNSDTSIEVSANLPLSILKAPFSTGYGIEKDGSVVVAESILKSNESQFQFYIRKSLKKI